MLFVSSSGLLNITQSDLSKPVEEVFKYRLCTAVLYMRSTSLTLFIYSFLYKFFVLLFSLHVDHVLDSSVGVWLNQYHPLVKPG
jgi:branched-subunit amino acid permease